MNHDDFFKRLESKDHAGKTAEQYGEEIAQLLYSIPRGMEKAVATAILLKQHRTHQQMIFSKFIGPMIVVYDEAHRNNVFTDGRNAGSVRFSGNVMSGVMDGSVEMSFPFI